MQLLIEPAAVTEQLGCLERCDPRATVRARSIPQAGQHGERWDGWALEQIVQRECERTVHGLCSVGNNASQQSAARSQRGRVDVQWKLMLRDPWAED